ncbi:multidrug MFS transporter [Streptomyces sp. SID8379]|uniref:terpene synthase family protein n=1 Tax=Streptomyces sp. SID8379 TaxID=2690359 RepID=UPI000476F0A7|nr:MULTISPECIES: multidrug MFS transporter [unclassified Streptomyces]MYW67432.1 multidrug MFS transporter [Streptomyces sp. SID8379]
MFVPAYPHAAVPPALALPVIEDAFPRKLHPYWPKLQQRTRTWLLEKRLMPADKVEKYADGLCYTDLVAGYYIGAPDELLAAIADFSAWFFAWDDRHDRDVVHGRTASWRRLAVQLHAATEAPHLHLDHADPLVAGFADCFRRFYGRLSRSWDARFARHFHVVIDAYDEEFRNRMTGKVPTVDEYIGLRRRTFAHWIWIDLLEPVAQYELPTWVRKNEAFMRAALATQDFSAWYNDLCSLPKELAGKELHNLGISLIKHEGISVREAAAEVHRRVEGTVAEFIAAERDIERTASAAEHIGAHGKELAAAIRSSVENMRNWFSSVYWFHHESGRYQVDTWDDRATPPYITDAPQTDQVGERA